MNDLYDLFKTQPAPEQAEYHPVDRDEWIKNKQAERKALFDLIDSTAQTMQTSGEAMQTYLDVQARFDRYSVSNAILISAQMPEATQLRTYDGWKEGGIYVNRGENAISILEPGKEYQRENGSTGVNYNVKKVFDISQTNSKARPFLEVPRDERALLKALISNSPCKMAISDEIPERLNAMYKPEDKTIHIRQGLDGPAIFRALSQELACAHMDKGSFSRNDSFFTAYCVSYVLCRRFGVAPDGITFDRMPARIAKMEVKEFRAELSKIRDTANEITSNINRNLEAQQKEQQAREQKDRDSR